MLGQTLQIAGILAVNSDTYAWGSPFGGAWAAPGNWTDTAIGSTATVAPTVSNTVSLTGGTGGNFVNIIGNGSAGSIAVSDDVLLWGTVGASGGLSLLAGATPAELDLDGGAALSAAGLTMGAGTALEAADGSKFTTSGSASITDGFVLATNGSVIQLATLIANGFAGAYGVNNGVIAVDDGASIEIGSAGGAALGAITIDSLHTAAVSGQLDGNVVLNGTLAVQGGGSLTIDAGDPFGSASTIAGSGLLVIDEDSTVTLGVADSAAIQFAAPYGTLDLNVLPSGGISGFAVGDTIELNGLATGLAVTQNATLTTLTLSKGGHTVGTLALAGNYAGDLFHIAMNAAGTAFVTEQLAGAAPSQPTVITGTSGSDVLIATANSQTLTGRGGDDTLNTGNFTGIDVKDTSADLNGSTILAFGITDTIDLTDMKPASAVVTYVPAVFSANAAPVPASLTINDGTHVAVISLGTVTSLPIGTWAVSSDGSTGSAVKYVTVNTDTYLFAPPTGDSYSVASNWRDTTASATATAAPGAGNSVTLAGGSVYLDVGGNGVAGAITATGDLLLLGTVVGGGSVVGINGTMSQAGTLALDAKSTLSMTGSALLGGMIEAGGASKLTIAGSTAFISNGASLLAIDGSAMQFGTVVAGSSPGVIGVDGNSSIEFGTTGGAKAGAITVDSGVTASFSGSIDGNVVVNGTLEASGRTVSIGGFGTGSSAVTGTGVLEIDNAGTLALAGSDTDAILFSASGGVLSLGTILPTGTITGFAKGDEITLDRSITGFSYSLNGMTTSTLTLLNGTTTVGTLILAGLDTAQQFQLQDSAAGTTSTITYAATPSGAVGNQVSSGTDGYSWTNLSGGAWSNAANWADTTTGKAAVSAPGSADAVVIEDNPGTLTTQMITGGGSAASLSIYGAGNTAFTGAYTIGSVFYVTSSGGGSVALEAGATVSAAAVNDYSSLEIAGGSTLNATGTSAGIEIVGAMDVIGGSRVRALGALDVGGGTLGVDATSTVEEGATGGAAAGTVTVDTGDTMTAEEGAVIAAKLVMNGTLITDYATIEGFGGTLGSISGTGTLQIGSVVQPGKLTLHATDSAAIQFYQAGDILELQGALPTGLISGFAAGDTIQFDQTVTGASFVQTSGTQGTLTLTDGAATVGTLTLLGSFASNRFQVDTAAATGFGTVSLLPTTSSAGSAAANTSGDSYSWTGASGGSWSTAANWTDTRTGLPATTLPSTGNTAVIGGNEAIGGNGSTGTLVASGYAVLTGQITVNGTVTTTSGTLALEGGAKLTASAGMIGGNLEAGSASTLTINNTASLVGGTVLALSGSTVQLGALLASGAGNVIAVDASSVVKVGSAPATAGAVNVGAGATAVMMGSIYGNVVTNGTLAAGGGGTLLIDMIGAAEGDPYGANPTIGGSGTLAITEGGTLGLGAIDSAAIQFLGPNATLALAAIPTGTISGFYAGDQIQLDQTVTGVSYTQVTATQASLTLSNGATQVGTLTLAGNFAGDIFHLDAAPNGGFATISLQTLGLAAAQPTLIQGTKLTETLTATANGQTLTGGGGNDTLNAAAYSSITFKDTTADMNFFTLQNFSTSDILDFTDMNFAAATAKYNTTTDIMSVSDGVHSANFHLAFTSLPTTGGFVISSDGAGGTKMVW